MDTTELIAWIREHQADLFQFADLEAVSLPDNDFHAHLEEDWFGDKEWNEPGYRFTLFGQDGTGGHFAVWDGPKESAARPVVLFGSEGAVGVLAASPDAFVCALAHGVLVEEYPREGLDGPARLSSETYLLYSRETECAEAKQARIRYRSAVEARFGELAALEQLVAVPDAMQRELCRWVATVQERANERELREQRVAEETKRQEKRAKAMRYVAAIEPALRPNVTALNDGARFQGVCAACAEVGTLRLIRFEELAFGLCTECYFSNAW